MPRKSSRKASTQGKCNTNWANRTVFQCAGLEALRGMNTGTVDLIVGEIPRFKAADFHVAQEKIHKNASFQDRWTTGEDVNQAWLEEIQNNFPAVWQAVAAARAIHGHGMGAFLCFMSLRLAEMSRVLRSTGSIYMHCDHSVSHYLKVIMDKIFGKMNFRNEIAWCYRGNANSKTSFPKKHNVLLFYVRSKNATFNPQYRPHSETERKRIMRVNHRDPDRFKQILERGAPVLDWWDDIAPLSAARREFPFQQPVELYERVIKASSNTGDMVLDPFYTHPSIIRAAENLGRQWVAISWMEQEDIKSEDVECREKPPERTDG